MCFAFNCSFSPINTGSLVVVNTTLGDTVVGVATYSMGQPPFDWSFLNLHQNENTSVVAAKALIASHPTASGSITYLLHGGTRDLVFQLHGVTYSIDPNRMFTANGRKTFLQPFSHEADLAVSQFAQFVLQRYDFFNVPICLALHNNGPGYSARSYLPGGPFSQDAQQVAIGTLFDARNFFYVVPGRIGTPLFYCMAKANLNGILQSNTTVTDDGSLSYFAALQNKEYVNIEAAAEDGGEGSQVIAQMQNLQFLVNILKQNK